MLMIAHFGDDAPTTPTTTGSVADKLEVAAFIFNNRNALIPDATTTVTLRGKSVSEQDIADGFTMAAGATLATQWAKDPSSEGVAFAVATIENDLRLGATVPSIITLLRAQFPFDARLSESVVAEAFRQVQVKRLPPPTGKPPTPPSSTNASLSTPIMASLAVAGLAAAVGGVIYVRRQRAYRFA